MRKIIGFIATIVIIFVCWGIGRLANYALSFRPTYGIDYKKENYGQSFDKTMIVILVITIAIYILWGGN